jgi:hypothetical protein
VVAALQFPSSVAVTIAGEAQVGWGYWFSAEGALSVDGKGLRDDQVAWGRDLIWGENNVIIWGENNVIIWGESNAIIWGEDHVIIWGEAGVDLGWPPD